MYIFDLIFFNVNTICLAPYNRFYFCAGVSLNIHSFIRITLNKTFYSFLRSITIQLGFNVHNQSKLLYGGIAPNEVIARSECEVQREIYTE